MQNWYLIQTKLREENIAIENLENQQFTTYCPKVLLKNKIVALFPRYVFVKSSYREQDISPIKSTKGVVNIVRFGSDFATVPDKIIFDLKSREKSTGDKMIEMNSLHCGDKVEILDGVFKGNNAIFSDLSGENRAIILLKILNQEQKIFIDNKNIKKF